MRHTLITIQKEWLGNEDNWVAAFYMSCFAMLGVLLRIAMAQLFGEECANPGTVGWIRTETPICVTADGETQRQGGIIFSVSLVISTVGFCSLPFLRILIS